MKLRFVIIVTLFFFWQPVSAKTQISLLDVVLKTSNEVAIESLKPQFSKQSIEKPFSLKVNLADQLVDHYGSSELSDEQKTIFYHYEGTMNPSATVHSSLSGRLFLDPSFMKQFGHHRVFLSPKQNIFEWHSTNGKEISFNTLLPMIAKLQKTGALSIVDHYLFLLANQTKYNQLAALMDKPSKIKFTNLYVIDLNHMTSHLIWSPLWRKGSSLFSREKQSTMNRFNLLSCARKDSSINCSLAKKNSQKIIKLAIFHDIRRKIKGHTIAEINLPNSGKIKEIAEYDDALAVLSWDPLSIALLQNGTWSTTSIPKKLLTSANSLHLSQNYLGWLSRSDEGGRNKFIYRSYHLKEQKITELARFGFSNQLVKQAELQLDRKPSERFAYGKK